MLSTAILAKLLVTYALPVLLLLLSLIAYLAFSHDRLCKSVDTAFTTICDGRREQLAKAQGFKKEIDALRARAEGLEEYYLSQAHRVSELENTVTQSFEASESVGRDFSTISESISELSSDLFGLSRVMVAVAEKFQGTYDPGTSETETLVDRFGEDLGDYTTISTAELDFLRARAPGDEPPANLSGPGPDDEMPEYLRGDFEPCLSTCAAAGCDCPQ